MYVHFTSHLNYTNELQLKSAYKNVHHLVMEVSGMGWNDAEQKVTAPADVWAKLGEVSTIIEFIK